MRKTSHDGGDSTSITSGVENEVKKSAMKPKKSSLKRKAPIFSNDSDDTVVEPLLQKDKQKTDSTPSAKYNVKGKTVSLQNKEIDNNTKTTSMTGLCGTTESLLSLKDSDVVKTTSDVPIRNYMNTNVFNSHDNSNVNITTKSQMLVEIDGNKQSGYNPSPLIFTTAKIHTDGKSKNMEPVQVTPVPILSTIEANVSKGGSVTTSEKKISNGSSVINPVYSSMPINKEKDEKSTAGPSKGVTSPTINKDAFSNITTTATNKWSNNTSVESHPTEVCHSLPSTTSKFITMTSNTNDKPSSFNDHENEKDEIMQPPLKTSNLDSTKNNVTDTTTTSNTAKNTVSKQLKRQKTITDETNDVQSKTKTNTESLGDSITKTESESHTKMKDNDKLFQISANNLQNINKEPSVNTTVNFVANVASISTAKKPITTNMGLSSVSSKSVTTSLSNSGKTPTTTTSAPSNGSKTSTVTSATTGTTAFTKSPEVIAGKIAVIPKSISTERDQQISSTQPACSETGKPPLITTPTAIKTTSVTSATSKTSVQAAFKSSSSVTSTSTTTSNQPSHSTKTPSITTSTKTPSGSSITTPNSKSPSNTSQATVNTKAPSTPVGLNTSIKARAATTLTLTTTTTIPVSSKTKTSQNITSAQGSSNKRPTTTATTNTITKTPAAGPSGKPSTVNSNDANTTNVKSPNNNSSQTSVSSKPSTTSFTKPSSSVTRTSVVSPSTNVAMTSTIKSPQGTSITKETSSSTKKPMVTKMQATNAKSPPVNNPITGGPIKVSSSAVAPVSTPINKQSDGKTVLIKTPLTTTSAKASSVTTTAKTSTATSTSSATAISTKINATTVPQVSTNKPAGIAGSSVPSSTPVLRPSETNNKKGGSKSSEKNKDGKVSKA